MKTLIGRIIDAYRPFWIPVGVVFCFLILGQTLFVVTPYINGKIVDAIVRHASMHEIAILASVALFIAIFHRVALFYFHQTYEIKNFDFVVAQHLAKKTLGKVLSFSIGQHINQHSGLQQSVILHGVHALTTIAYRGMYEIVPQFLQIIGTIIALCVMDFVIGIVVIVGIALFTLISIHITNRLKDPLKKIKGMETETEKLHAEILRNVELIITNAQEHQMIEAYDIARNALRDFQKHIWIKHTKLSALRQLIVVCATFVVTVISAYFVVVEGKYTAGTVVMFFSWTAAATAQLGMVSQIHRQFMDLFAMVQKFFELTDVPPAVECVANPLQPIITGKIEFQNISFTYPRRDALTSRDNTDVYRPALDRINFIINPGERVALVGRSGAGKTTIRHLLVRAYDPDQGSILIDGVDLRLIDLHYYRDSIGVVEQDVMLFDNTLRFNILFPRNGTYAPLTDIELNEIGRIARINTFYHQLEHGFDTVIGEEGVRLSGGQRQILAIARALVKNPRILIFDEATAHLDAENESAIRHSIEEASKDRTTIIIAHRLSTIKSADKIIVLDHGRVVGIGDHETLVKTCDIYATLIAYQESDYSQIVDQC